NEIKGNHPIYACFGNHDYKAFRDDKEGLIQYTKEIEQSGIQLLHNKTICMEKGSKKYSITGIADMKYGDWNIEEALATRCKDADTILAFTHNPDAVLSMPPKSVEYLFTGHFHGGQVWLPFNLEFLTLRKEKLCRMGIRRNLHKVNDINIYINRGLGNVCLPIRFLSRPEITVFLI
ncbi:MAG: metallophosphoesterase, partial [Bacillota bacterium]|nr:metallophosphoesterase [Bacillota bacterium]